MVVSFLFRFLSKVIIPKYECRDISNKKVEKGVCADSVTLVYITPPTLASHVQVPIPCAALTS